MATISEVAARAGVGIGTVSRVLNNSPAVSPTTRERVLAIIRELDYHPNQLARRFSLGQTYTIGIVVPFFTRPSAVERLKGIVDTLGTSRYDLVLFNVDSPSKRLEHLRSLARRGRTDGIIVISLPLAEAEVEQFRAAGVPVVGIDVRLAGLSHIYIDDRRGGYLATRHLLALGHTRVAYIGDLMPEPYGFTSSQERFEGFRQALEEAGLPLRPDYVKSGPHGRDAARQLTGELLALPLPPTAIFAASDTQAVGVLEAARLGGVAVPRELSVIGFDDIEIAPYAGLTTIHQPLYQSGVLGARTLLQALAAREGTPEEQDTAGDTHGVELPLELVTRRTTAPLVPPPPASTGGGDPRLNASVGWAPVGFR